jgi:hypothetical protein
MFSEFALRGRWWLPDKPGDQIPGIVRFSNERIELQLDRSFFVQEFSSAWSKGSVKAPVILGYTTDGGSCSLLRAIFWRWSGDEMVFVVNAIVIGAHIEDEIGFPIQKSTIKVTHLEEWAAPRLIHPNPDTASGEITITAPLEPKILLSVKEIPQLKLLFLKAGVQSSLERNQITLTNEAQFHLEFDPPISLTDFNRILRKITNLLSLLVGEAVYPRKVLLETRDERRSDTELLLEYFFALRASPPRKKSEFEMTLPLNALGESGAGDLIRNWFSNDDKLRPVCDLLLGTVYNPSLYVQSTFLSLAQALESLHRRLYEGTYLPKGAYTKISETLKAAIPKDTPPNLKVKLGAMLTWGNELSLKNRLKELFEGLDQTIAKDLAGNDDLQEFVRLVVDVRNYLTHYDESCKRSIIDSLPEMYNLNQRIRAILTLLIFKYLGVDEVKVFLPLKGNLGLVL